MNTQPIASQCSKGEAPRPPSVADLAALWLDRASSLERYAPSAAEAFRSAASELADAIRRSDGECLSLAQAAAESGYSSDSLRHMVAEGKIPNAGRKNKPLVRRADLPRRVTRAPGSTVQLYNPDADARRLAAR